MNKNRIVKNDPVCNTGIISCLKTIEGKKGIFSILLIATILTIYEIIFFYKIVAPDINNIMNNNLNDLSKEIYSSINNINVKKNKGIIENEENKGIIENEEIKRIIENEENKRIIENEENKGIIENEEIKKSEDNNRTITKIFNTLKKYKINNNNNILDFSKKKIIDLFFNNKIKATLNTFSNREKILTNHINKYTFINGLLLLTFLIILMIFLWKNIKNSKLELNENKNMYASINTSILTVFILIIFQILFYFFGKVYYYPGNLGNEELASIMLKEIKI